MKKFNLEKIYFKIDIDISLKFYYEDRVERKFPATLFPQVSSVFREYSQWYVIIVNSVLIRNNNNDNNRKTSIKINENLRLKLKPTS